MTSPVTIVSLDPETDEFKFHENILADMVLSERAQNEDIMNLPVAVISIAGDFRKGKSFLLNFFLRYLQRYDQEDWIGDPNEPLEGFAWDHGIDRVTSGIVIWPEPFIIKRNDGTKIAVVLMDTQGMFDDCTDIKKVEQFYRICVLVSSVQIYNKIQQIQSDDIDHLAVFSSYGQKVLKKTGHKAFQKLLFLIRDWPNEKEFKFGFDGGQRLLQHKRSNQREKFAQQWSMLNDCYSDIDCFLMPSRGDQANQPEFKGEINQLKPIFIEYLRQLIPSLLSPENIVTKSWEGKEQKFWEVSNHFKRIAEQLQGYKTIHIDKLLSISDEVRTSNAVGVARLRFIEIAFKGRQDEQDISQVFVEAENQALEHFESETRSVDDALRNLKRRELLETFEAFKSTFYKDGPKDEKWWKTALKYATIGLLHFGWYILVGRLTGPFAALFRAFRFLW